jgi:hypothetical protein
MVLIKNIILVILVAFSFGAESKIVASDGDADDRFGKAVSLSSDWFAIGANRDDDHGSNSGSAYVYKYENNMIVSEQKLLAFDGSNNDYFGKSLSMYNDWLVVSALYDDVNGEKSGSVYVFHLVGDIWNLHTKLVPDDGQPFDRFGYAVDIYDDVIAVSAVYDDDLGQDSGSVYVYRLQNNIWEFETKIFSSYPSDGDFFGISVACEHNVIGVSAIYDDNIGSVTLFNYDEIWIETQRIVPEDGEEYDLFGNSIHLNNSLLAVGSFHDDNIFNNSGSVYIYQSENNIYNQLIKITPFDESLNDNFGQSVSIYDNYLSVGSINDDNGINSGSVYVYALFEDTILNEFKYTPEDISDFDEFSGSVSLFENSLLVGSQYDDDLGISSGSAYLFTYKGCSDQNACNFDETFMTDNSDCEYTQNNFDCEGECGEIIDECGVCSGLGVSGDVNYDQDVNILDIILILDFIIDENIYDINMCTCDMNFNSIVNITDIVILLNIILD